jgi:parallel beta helix pectate lyase-like protein
LKKHPGFIKIFSAVFICILFLYAKKGSINKIEAVKTKTCYFSASGNDNNDGSIYHPFQTINKLNSLKLHAGDSIKLNGGNIFSGSILIDSLTSGTVNNNISITSYGNGKAIINAGNNNAVTLYKTSFISISNIQLIGSGRKTGNTKDGLLIKYCKNISIKDADVSGFQKAGLLIFSSEDVTNSHVYAHNNGAAGIEVQGTYAKKESSHNIYIGNCVTENNPGDPTNLDNHSGNGIVVGDCRNVMIEYCTATNNGWDMPRIGNGPVGIWAYEADSVTIQHCLSYKNKTSVGGADGGGFDLDGGVTNSIVQYCMSYENQGAGYCIFQYLYASPWHDNTFRFNISENDGLVSDARAGIHIWNSSRDSNQFYNSFFYNNTIYNTKGAAISYSELSDRKKFFFFNNIFVGEDSIIKGEKGIDIFLGNNWWSLKRQFNIDYTYNFKTWAEKNNQEILEGKITGFNINPGFKNPGNIKITSASLLNSFDSYKIPAGSLLQNNGIDLYNLYGIKSGNIDFNNQPVSAKAIGASF